MSKNLINISKENIPDELCQSRVMIYGAGALCKKVIDLLRPYQINICYIVDDDVNKCGSKVEGIEIISYSKFKEMCEQSHDICVVMTTIYGKTVLRQLEEIETLNVYEMYDWLDQLYNLNSFADGVNDKEKIRKFQEECSLLKSKLTDEESHKVLDGLCTYLDTKDFNIISDICTEYDQYFIPEILSAIHEPLSLIGNCETSSQS